MCAQFKRQLLKEEAALHVYSKATDGKHFLLAAC